MTALTADKSAASAGALLAAARQVSGLSIEAVAQQLKLSPRQVRALEDGDYNRLPGRTFVRGFVRNYARLVKLDPERVLDALPSAGVTPTLEAPTLQPTVHAMGELPTAERAKATWTRWAIPVLLGAIVAAAAIYEWARPVVAGRSYGSAKEVGEMPAQSPVAEKNETPLPNPVAGGVPAPATGKEDAGTAAPAAQPAVPTSPEPAPTKGATNAP